jgi:hypothetical protein
MSGTRSDGESRKKDAGAEEIVPVLEGKAVVTTHPVLTRKVRISTITEHFVILRRQKAVVEDLDAGGHPKPKRNA